MNVMFKQLVKRLTSTFIPIEVQVHRVLSTVEHNDDPHRCYEARDKLEKLGLTYIGQGHFSTVWALPNSDRVLKISHRSFDCCRDYMNWVFRNPGMSPHAPKIWSYRQLDDLVYVQMDTYFPVPHHMKTLGYLYRPEFEGVFIGYEEPDPDNPLHTYLHRVAERYPDDRKDLHWDNVMLDSDGVFIITDPVSFDNSPHDGIVREAISTRYGPINDREDADFLEIMQFELHDVWASEGQSFNRDDFCRRVTEFAADYKLVNPLEGK